jgi:2-polyprenyl-3-methyl-5-hydroxy-6-metoxy-1,4-benzoquinol methylase
MGINAYGIDIDPIWCRYLEQKFNIVVLPTRLESYKYSITPDLIYSSHTIEHTESPRLFLQKCLQIASPDAFLYLDTPDTYYQEKTGNRWHHLETRTPFEHLCLLSERSLEILCQQTGWQLVWFARFLEFQSFQAILQKKGKGL